MQARYASDPARTRGRQHAEPESTTRTPFQRDRDRIIHSSAFRRLKHKTQVFVEHEGDYYRTRLTHSIEVAQVARTLAQLLGLNTELAEAIALAHDLGHTPFGHTGEDALGALMAPFGGFDHNAQAIRIVTSLERHYAGFDGLNLTWETLEGLAKHNGPVTHASPAALADYLRAGDLMLETYASAEAQVAAIADDVAYNHHDLHDGLRSGLFTEADLAAMPVTGPAFAAVDAAWPGLEPMRRRHEALRRVFGRMVDDVTAVARGRHAAADPADADAVRALGAAGDRLLRRPLRRAGRDPRLPLPPDVPRAPGDGRARPRHRRGRRALPALPPDRRRSCRPNGPATSPPPKAPPASPASSPTTSPA